jgi:hypothetical protein
MLKPEDRLERELRQGLRSVTAPPELWDRVRAAQFTKPPRSNRRLVWALAAGVALIAVGLSVVQRESVVGDEAFALRALASDSQRIAFHCQNPAQLRAWVRAQTGLDVPLRANPPASIQLIGARNLGASAEIAYRAGDQAAVLLVSRAGAGSANVAHNRVSGNVSSWVMDGQRYTLASNDPADLQLACKLCHLD